MDILNLRDLAKEKVKAEFGIELEEEVKIISN
jgi:UDP-N-acetylenolpyruvoylglucosamine reductase